MQTVTIDDIEIGPGKPLAIMSGPCVIESEEHAFACAKELKEIFKKAGVRLIFKASYDKANRSSKASFRGPGLKEGLRILERIKHELSLPVVSDIHTTEEALIAGEILDILQIPAFLCRQTDLVCAAASTKAAISVKKGQFVAPLDMKNVVEKVVSEGNNRLILTDRGTSFGYNNLVSDMRSIPIMQQFGFPVCFDATHSVQLPGGLGATSGGQREFIPVLAKAAIAAGANCLFMEVHPNPAEAKSDAQSVMAFSELPKLLSILKRLYETVQADNL